MATTPCMSVAEFVAGGGELPPDFAKGRSATNAQACGKLKYVSPWEWTARYNAASRLVIVSPPVGSSIYFTVTDGSFAAYPSGTSRKRRYRVQLLSADGVTPCTNDDPVYLSMVDEDGSKIKFSVASGQVVSMTSATGKVMTRENYEQNNTIIRDDEGNLTAFYCATEGLMTTQTNLDGSYGMAWYAPDKVQMVDGTPVGMGEPYKTVMYQVEYTEAGKTVTITRQAAGRPAHVETRVENGNTVTFYKGTGDDTIIRTIETNRLYGNMQERIESIRGINDIAPVSCHRTVKMSTEGGWLVVSETEAFNTDIAQTTTYEYNNQSLVTRINYHNGNYVEYEYDSEGRVTKETRPWGDGGKQMTRNVYAANSSRFYDTRPIKVYTDYEDASGKFLNLAVTDYTYEDSAEVERITATTYAAGVNHQQVTIDETYGEAAAYAYAVGKPKFSQAVNGVQTWHDYEATSEHDAIHKHTVTTKANGELVAAQSRKTETFIAEDETTIFTQESIWDGTQWLLLNTTAYEYDDEQRVTKTTRGNGRFSTTEWMCCGKLRETDEDGITTTYAYDSAHQLIETSRDAVYDGDVCVTPETITEYTRDAAGRVLSTTRRIGAMETTESTEYDALGRVIKQTDVLGRETANDYNADGLASTVTTPAGATFITTSYPDGSTKEISGTGQRAQQYSYDINGKNIATTVRLMNDAILSQDIVNGFGQTVVQAQPNTLGGFIYTRSEYNVKGQMVKQYQDTGWNTTKTAPTLYEYDAFGNMVKQTLALSDTPTKEDSPVVEMVSAVESLEDGVYFVSTQTHYSAEGQPISRTQKQLISQLSETLASKSISTDVRGNSSVNWTEYTAPTKQTSFSTVPTSNITAESISIDGFTLSQKDHAGIITTAFRSYTAMGMSMEQVDGRNNATTIHTDLAGRTISVTDAANATTTTAYDSTHDLPAVITDALGNTSYYKYDARSRKIAEWGSALQPACFGYDDMNNMTMLRTFRAENEVITTDPSERSDYDQTTWGFDAKTGLEISKTYADSTSVVKTYDAYNRLATETDARGNVKTHSYEHARGLHLGITYNTVDGTTTTADCSFSYNHLGQMVQVVDDAGTRSFGYNSYGERETDSLAVDGDTHLITEQRDSFGRSIGYVYSKNGTAQQTVITGYGTDGRISSAGFLHGSEAKNFGYTYLAGTNLLQVLTKPNGMTLTQTYEATRDLLTSMAYYRGSTLVAQRTYSYDILGRPTARNTARQGKVVNDTFAHNTRSELVSAQVNGTEYEYAYDNIGNRQQATEGNEVTVYDANSLNQYTAISKNGAAAFVPQFDADGNQILTQTETGIWSAVYNAENRPVTFTNGESNIVVECAYDSMGRRAYKKVRANGSITLHQRYIYRGYLQIACIDLTRSHHPSLWFITWDPTQPIATRPLALQKDGTWYTYGWDLTKNVCEVFGSTGYIATTYTYAPYGEVNASGNVKQPIQWSSEYNDEEITLHSYSNRFLTYYGNWLIRDVAGEKSTYRLYSYCHNSPILSIDILGNNDIPSIGIPGIHIEQNRRKYKMVSSQASPAQPTVDSHIRPLPPANACCGPDVTDWIVNTIKENIHYLRSVEKEHLDNLVNSDEPSSGLLFYLFNYVSDAFHFRDLVNHNGVWDYKRGNFNSKNCPSKGCENTVTLCKKCFPKDIVGNIVYSAVGRYMFPAQALRNGGHAAAAPDWLRSKMAYIGIGEYDAKDDITSIEVGINFYNSSMTSESLCGIINSVEYASLVDSNQFNAVKNCKPCSEKAIYSR